MTKPLADCLLLLVAAHAGAALAQSRPDAAMRERAAPDNVLMQRESGGGTLLQRREWPSAVPGPRRPPEATPATPSTPAVPATPATAATVPTAASPQQPPPAVAVRRPARAAPPVAVQRGAEAATTPADPATAAGAVLARAWVEFDRGEQAAAASLFEEIADSTGSAAVSARHGLTLIALRQSRLDDAEALARSLPATYAERPALLRDIAIVRAQARYAAGRHAEAMAALAAAAQEAPLPRHARALEAWSLLAAGQDAAAATRFETLYREAPDAEAADGVLLSFVRAGREAELPPLAREEPLAGRYRRHLAERAYFDKRFGVARELDPERFGGFGSGGTLSGEVSLARREKSSTGLAEMALDWGPSLALRWPGSDGDEWSLRAESLRVSSPGQLGRNIPAVSGFQPQLAWRSDAEQRWEAAIGMTPSGGPVEPDWEAALAGSMRIGAGSLRLAAYRQGNKESMLAYVGMRDPASGRAWGRVLMQGVQASWRGPLAGRWSLALQARHDDIGGERVAANRRDAFDLGIGYDLKLEGFDYAVLSLNGVADRFARNLSHFTPGHGGYFSPQSYGRIGPAFDFMTAEGRSFLLKGRAAVGETSQQEAAAPVLPLADNGLRYAASSSRGRSWEVDVGGAWQFAPRLQLGGWVSYRKSLDYEDRAAMLTLRLLLEPRRGVLSTDLPTINRLFQ